MVSVLGGGHTARPRADAEVDGFDDHEGRTTAS